MDGEISKAVLQAGVCRDGTLGGNVSQAELLSRASTISREEQRALADRLLDRVRATVHYFAAGDRDEDDLVQIAMVEILRSAASFRGEARLETWADRIVIRTCLRAIQKRRKRELVVRPTGDVLEEDDRSPEAIATVGAGSLPEKDLALRQVRQRLSVLLQRLPLERRLVIVLRWMHNYNLEEIAAMVDAPLNTVRDRLQVGKRQLRTLLLRDPVLKEWAEARCP
jgi:RNA polymerase sigma-70 factor, ECF subfamily